MTPVRNSQYRVPDRIRQIVDAVDVNPDDHILEIGCGHGVAVDLICERLVSGKVTAIDRSQKMINAAMRRNWRHIEASKVEFVLGDVETLQFTDSRFDKIVASRIGLFHRQPEFARSIVEPWLKPDGKLLVFYDEPVPRKH
jgi:ubiquinone/menaquinone biosynthesis C-methylase UbiE